MAWFDNLKITHKLLVAFFSLLLLVSGLGFFALDTLGQLRRVADESADLWGPGVQHLSKMRSALLKLRNSELSHLVASSPEGMERFEREAKQSHEEFAQALEGYRQHARVDSERQMLDGLEKDWERYLDHHERLLALSRRNKTEQGMEALQARTEQSFDAVMGKMNQLVSQFIGVARQAATQASQVHEPARRWILIVMISIVLIGTLLCFVVARSITRPLAEAVRVADRIAEGELSVSIEVTTQDEAGQMLAALKRMVRRLEQTLREVSEGAGALAAAAAQVAASSQSLSQGTSQQASSVEEMTASLAKMSASIHENGNHGQQMARKGAAEAAESGKAVKETVEAMGDMNSVRAELGVSGLLTP